MLRLSSRVRPVITVQREVHHLYHVRLVTIVELLSVTLLYQVHHLTMILYSTSTYIFAMIGGIKIE